MKCSVVVRAGCVLLSPRFLERTGIPGAMLVKIRTPAEARGWDKSRTPTDHELPRDFPEGAFAMSALGIKERQDGKPPDLTTPRGRHTTAALVTGERRCRMRGVGEMLISGRGETSIGMKMAATRRGEMASAIPIGGWVSTTSSPIPIGGWVSTTSSHIGRSVGGHDLACSEPGNSCSAPCRWVG
jgi:hypothetical protein